MTPEAQQIAIAEACGWYRAPYEDGWYESAWRKGSELVGEHTLPDYLNDLNAMHEAEGTLNRVQCVKFVDELCGLVGVDWRPTSHFNTVHATAAQRAEAFLRTIGKWEDSQ